jgi:hypothetical protein
MKRTTNKDAAPERKVGGALAGSSATRPPSPKNNATVGKVVPVVSTPTSRPGSRGTPSLSSSRPSSRGANAAYLYEYELIFNPMNLGVRM